MNTSDDDLAIRRLLAEYCHAYDDGTAERFAALFTTDAELVVSGRTYAGRGEIRTIVGLGGPDRPPGQHVTYNSVIDPDVATGRARARTDFCYLRRGPDGLEVTTAGRYHDHLVREPDGWRFRRRTIVFLGDDVPEGA